jgi:hypothetical protein
VASVVVSDGSITDAKIAAGIDKSKVGLGQVDNTSDEAKPISIRTKAYVDAQVASGVVDGSITDAKIAAGIDKSKVGLDQVDNISDAAKPISTDTQTALDTKANTKSPEFTGVPTAPTALSTVNTDQIATTKYVTTALTGTDLNVTQEIINDYTVNSTDDVVLCSATSVITLTLPTTDIKVGKKIYVCSGSDYSIDILPTLRGTAAVQLPGQTSYTLMYIGSGSWTCVSGL